MNYMKIVRGIFGIIHLIADKGDEHLTKKEVKHAPGKTKQQKERNAKILRENTSMKLGKDGWERR